MPETAAFTHERALQIDQHQYASGRGPCLEAAWQRAPVRAVIGEERQRWPEFVPVRTASGHPREFVGSAAGRWQHSRETVTQLEKALLSRSDIDMAKGALISLHGCEPEGRYRQARGRISTTQHQSAQRRPRNARAYESLGALCSKLVSHLKDIAMTTISLKPLPKILVTLGGGMTSLLAGLVAAPAALAAPRLRCCYINGPEQLAGRLEWHLQRLGHQ